MGGEADFSSYVGRVAAWMLVSALPFAGLAAWLWGRMEACALLYAAILSVVNMILLGSGLMALPDVPQRAGRRLGASVVQRWIFTVVALLVAIVWLHLPVPGLVAGLVLSHLVYLGFMLRERSRQRS